MSKFEKTWSRLYDAVYKKTGSTAETQSALSALGWYMYSGRMPLVFEERLNACTDDRIDRVADRLVKNSHMGYEKAIRSVKQALGIRKNTI